MPRLLAEEHVENTSAATAIDAPYKTVADHVADAKVRPGQVAFASGGNATMSHLLPEQFQLAAGLKLVHVPCKGGAPR